LVFLLFSVRPQSNVWRIDSSTFNIHDMLIWEREESFRSRDCLFATRRTSYCNGYSGDYYQWRIINWLSTKLTALER
jgi:hypothetical protein